MRALTSAEERREDGRGRRLLRHPVLAYAVLAAGLVLSLATLVAWLTGASAGRAVWLGAATAYVVQVFAFAALWRMRDRATRFFAAWGGGTLLRMGVVLGAGVWLARTSALPAAPLLLALAGFLFVLLLLEPLVFRAGMRSE